MAAIQEVNLMDDFIRQHVDSEEQQKLWEDSNVLGQIFDDLDASGITEKGMKIPEWTSRSDGMAPLPETQRSYAPYTAPEGGAMYIYDVRYGQPVVFPGTFFDLFEQGGQVARDVLYKMSDILTIIRQDVAKKRNYLFYSDRSGIFARATSALGAVGANQTLTLSTTGGVNTFNEDMGGYYLWRNNNYLAVDPVALTVRGSFTVQAEGFGSVVVNLTAGTIAANDYIVPGWGLTAQVFNNYFQGLSGLIDGANRFFQGRQTVSRFQRSTVLDLVDTTLTPTTFSDLKITLAQKNNDPAFGKGFMCAIAPGHLTSLANQGMALRRYEPGDATRGMPQEYVEPGVKFIGPDGFGDADAPRTRAFLWKSKAIKKWESRKFGWNRRDGNTYRQRVGSNNTGSDEYYGNMSHGFNLGQVNPSCCAQIRRISTTNVKTVADTF